MENRGIRSLVVMLAAAVVVAALLSLVFSGFVSFSEAPTIAASLPTPDGSAATLPGGAVTYNPPGLDEAPENIRAAVMLGAGILTDTQQYAGDYVGNALTCSTCHFNGGYTEGGKNGGISLVGVAATYPQYQQHQDYAADLVIRVNDCFRRSMNGKPLPPESREMTAVLTYFQWIARGIPVYAEVPWLQLKPIESDHEGDATAGEQVYAARCAACHGAQGEGTAAGAPLWGDRSYNDGAGMARPATLAAFSLANMPRGNPSLTETEALDVGAFVNSQPRPKLAGTE